jgi:hypothetical protein
MDHPFLSEWAKWKEPQEPPYYFSADEEVLMEELQQRNGLAEDHYRLW